MATFNGGIVFVHEMCLYQLDGQTRLSHTTTANDDQLVFSKKLSRTRDAVSVVRHG